jgi:hypothetical protein
MSGAEIPGQRARIAEIEREHGAWLEGCRAADQAAGVDAAQEALEEIVKTIRSFATQIAAMRATTLAGMRARALVIRRRYRRQRHDRRADHQCMIRDLLSIEAA